MTLGRARIPATLIVLGAVTVTPTAGAGTPAGEGAGPGSEARKAATIAAMKEIHDLQRNIGLAVAVSVEGRTVFTGTLGMASVEHQVPVRNQTRFLVASVTKAFTGATLMKLRGKGMVDLDAPITRYVPEAPGGETRSITVRDLAAHVAGIRRYRDGEKSPEFLSRHYSTAGEALRIFIDDPLVSEPGTAYLYTSFGYDLLAAAMEAVAGKPFPRIVEEEILVPLGLGDTGFHDVRRITSRLASNYTFYVPYTYDPVDEPMPAPWEDYSYNQGGGNMYTTTGDLLRFAQAFMKEGFFTRESLDLFYARQGPEEAGSPWSFGWFVIPGPDPARRIYINGAFTGVQAGLYIWPGERIAVAVLSNSWGVGSKSGDMTGRLPRTIGEIWSEGWEPGTEGSGR